MLLAYRKGIDFEQIERAILAAMTEDGLINETR